MNTNLELIRQKCVEANPDRGMPWEINGVKCPPRLADVLLAMFEADAEERAEELIHGSVKVWNLRRDSLDEQSMETITFLAELLK